MFVDSLEFVRLYINAQVTGDGICKNGKGTFEVMLLITRGKSITLRAGPNLLTHSISSLRFLKIMSYDENKRSNAFSVNCVQTNEYNNIFKVSNKYIWWFKKYINIGKQVPF